MSDYIFVGLLCVDNIYEVPWYPPEDSDSRCQSKRTSVGGNATNSAIVFQQFMSKYHPDDDGIVLLHSAVSDDLLSEKALNELKRLNISLTWSSFIKGHILSESVCIVASKSGSRTIVHDPGTIPEISFQKLPDVDWNRVKLFHFEGRNPTNDFNGISKVYALVESVLEKKQKENSTFLFLWKLKNLPIDILEFKNCWN